MGAGASAESSSAALAAAGEVKSEAAAKAVQDAVASLPKLQQDSAAAMFDKAGSAMTSEQLTSAAQDVISSAGKIEAGEGQPSPVNDQAAAAVDLDVLKKEVRIVRLILKDVRKVAPKLERYFLAEVLKKILSVQIVLILQSVWVEMLKQFISFSMFMMKTF